MVKSVVGFERIHNLRDLGGLGTGHGVPIRARRLCRSAAPIAATAADLARLTRDTFLDRARVGNQPDPGSSSPPGRSPRT